MNNRKRTAFSAAILLSFSLTACAVQPAPDAASSVSSAAAEAPGKPESEKGGKIWDYLDSDLQKFAAGFSENDIYYLTYYQAGVGGVTSYTVYDTDMIRQVFDALDRISVTEETLMAADDFEDSFVFTTWQDETCPVSFNMHNLETGSRYYLLEEDESLWNLAAQITKEILPDGTQAPEEEFTLAQCREGNFQFFYPKSYGMEEGENNSVSLYPAGEKDPLQRITVSRTFGQDAYEYLEEKAAEIRMRYEDTLTSPPESPALQDTESRILYGISAEYETDSGEYIQTILAENYADESLVCYEIYCGPELREEAEAALGTILDTIELGVMDSEPEDSPENAQVFTEGRWSWTVETRSDGSTEYCFDDLLIVDIPENWEGKYQTEVHDNFFSFYQTGSYNRFMEEYGSPGGHLFTVAWYPDKEYENLPSYQYLGLAPEGYYVMLFPTDVQGWMDDGPVWEEWQQMQEGMPYVRDNAMSMLFS